MKEAIDYLIGKPRFGDGVVADYEVIEGESITLSCDVDSDPAPRKCGKALTFDCINNTFTK